MLWWIIAVLLGVILYIVISRLLQKRYLTVLTQEEFKQGYRKAQLIDVREPNEFKNGHILGARNIPQSQLRMRLGEIRKDKPVYLYCDGTVRSSRAAQILKRKGYRDLYLLKGGFKKWTGKIKVDR